MDVYVDGPRAEDYNDVQTDEESDADIDNI